MSDKIDTQSEVTEKCLLPKTVKQEIELSGSELGQENSISCNDKIIENNSTNIKNDLPDDAMQTLLSEGEASSGFETVSSVDSDMDPDDFNLSSTADEDDFNVVVEIENELAFQSHKGSSERTFYWKEPRTTDGYDTRTKDFLNDFSTKKYDDFRIANKKHKYWKNNAKDLNFEYDEYRDNEDRKNKKFSERKGFAFNRRQGLQDQNWDKRNTLFRKHCLNKRSDYDSGQWHNRNFEYDSGGRRSRSSDRDSRSRHSRSSDYDNRAKVGEGSSEQDSRPKRSRSRTRDSSPKRTMTERYRKFLEALRNPERNPRGKRGRRAERRCSRSFERNTPTELERDSPSRNRSSSKTPTSVWTRLERRSPSREMNRKRTDNFRRKKERTPFLVELERKLREAERLKESKKENLIEPSVPIPTNDNPPVSEKAATTTLNPVPAPNLMVPQMQRVFNPISCSPVPPRFPRIARNVGPLFPTNTYPLPSIPTLGVPLRFTCPPKSEDNLPLVLGPTGLPVHITLTGEQIPYDVDGKRIPMGPNGYYLPLDPTGRLFPHIVSPGNQAIPIHMTDDGVLRLPNSEPVPYGPPHKLPVDIDGLVIPIGPDSRPLFPCPNMPREPPANLRKMISVSAQTPNLPQVASEAPTMGNQAIVPSEEPMDTSAIPPQPIEAQTAPRTAEIGIQEITPPTEVTQVQPPPPVPIELPPLPKSDYRSDSSVVPETEEQEMVSPEEMQSDSSNEHDIEPPSIDCAIAEIIENPSKKINKAHLLKKYKKKALQRSEDIEKCKEIEKNLGVKPSKGGVKRSIPMNFSKKKASKKIPDGEDSNITVTDMVLESDDSDSPTDLKHRKRPRKGSVEEVLGSSDDEQDILKAVCDTEKPKSPQASAGAKPKDAITKKVEQAIKSLGERNYKPPAVGRCIISCLVDPIMRKSPNESPLLRNRINLPFITPNAVSSETKENSSAEEETEISFKFLPQEVPEKSKKTNSGLSKPGKTPGKNLNARKIPVFTFDFAMQCDFTSSIIEQLNSKIAGLELEVVKLKNINANLIDNHNNLQALNKKKSAELVKAIHDIREKNKEIQYLKSSLEKK